MIKTCPICGQQFETRNKRLYCTDECKKKAKAAYMRAYPKKNSNPFAESEWLTIPDTPNYEINRRLQVRNKKTGRFLKQRHICTDRHNPDTILYSLYYDGKIFLRSADLLLRQALNAVDTSSTFLPIPSLGNLYEINRKGVCRHVKLLTPLKARNGCFYFNINGERFNRSKANLLFEVFGITAKRSTLRLPVILSKGNKRLYFDSKKEAAIFLAPLIFLSPETVRSNYLSKYVKNIHGWEVTYSNEDCLDYARSLNAEARRQKRVYDSTVKAQENNNGQN